MRRIALVQLVWCCLIAVPIVARAQQTPEPTASTSQEAKPAAAGAAARERAGHTRCRR